MAKKNGNARLRNGNGDKVKSMENWIWDAACSIRGAQDAPKYKDFILPLIFVKRLCDVFDDEIDRIDFNATTHGQRDIDDDRLSKLIEKIAEKPLGLKDKIYLLHAGKEFEKGYPKSYITPEGIERIAETFKQFKDVEKFARLVDKEEIVKNDFNISPSRYIQINDAETYRPIEEIVEELNMLEEEAVEIDNEVETILEKLGVK